MSKPKGGTASYCQITGVLGRSEEPSPRFMITGRGYEFSSSGGIVTKTPIEVVCVRDDLRDENLRLGTISLGTTITWTEFKGQGKCDHLHNFSIRVVPPRRRVSKKH